ncbi:fimbrial protein [Pseudomonas sp. NY15436]|uniref:fimbrial protein n=1 Tax=Pseudomonas sp. NY15436 TaxID=3400359 RepID=UPI003A8C45F5
MSRYIDSASNQGVLFRLVLGLVLALFARSVWAQCSFDSGYSLNNATVTLPSTLTARRDMPVGTILFDSGWVNGGSTHIRCNAADTISYGYASAVAPVSGMQAVYETGVPGIGIKAAYSNSYASQPANIDSVNPTAGSALLVWPRSVSSDVKSTGYTPAGLYRIQLVVTGPLVSGSRTMILPNPTAQTIYGSLLTNQASFSTPTVIVETLSCTVNTPTVAVPLKDVLVRQFQGVGSTLGTKPFTVDVTCPGGVAVAYQLDGTSPSGGGAMGLIQNSSGTGMATGVAVQVLKSDGSTPLPLATQTSLGTSVSENQAMPISLNARYYQTESSVSPGQVSATAYVTMYYQ